MAQHPILTDHPELVKPCVSDAIRKCDCGATLKSPLDVQLHRCDPMAEGQRSQIAIAMEDALGFHW